MAAKKKKKPGKAPKSKPELLEGVLVRSTGSWYKVRLAETGKVLDCRLRGKFRNEVFKATNPVAVGDRVMISVEEEVGFIRKILPRHNYILRKSINLSKRVHVLCANVDQALILFSLADPVTTLGYVDRLLVSCQAYEIEPIIIFNKIDLLESPEEQEKLKDFQEIYARVGYETRALSAHDSQYREVVTDLLRDKVSFVVGRSGAGKSTLINLVAPELNLKTKDISEFSGRGRHTTVFAEMFDLPFGGHIIDSPGFKEMEIYDIKKTELCHYFPEMRPYLDDCKFNNCIHTREPNCAVKKAVEAGRIPISRYHTYTGMLHETGIE